MSIRGKIVSQKLAKAYVFYVNCFLSYYLFLHENMFMYVSQMFCVRLSPMLSRLGLAFADVSDDVTNILKTLRYDDCRRCFIVVHDVVIVVSAAAVVVVVVVVVVIVVVVVAVVVVVVVVAVVVVVIVVVVIVIVVVVVVVVMFL